MHRAATILVLLVAAQLGSAGDPFGAVNPSAPPPSRPAHLAANPFELVLPNMNFRDAQLSEILDWIRDRSREADPAGAGVNLILKDDPRGTLAATRLTLRLTRPTVRQALDLLATTAGLYIRRERHVAVIERSRATSPSR